MINPQNIYQKLETLGTEWAMANCAADLLEETKKTMLASLMIGLEGSHASKEQQALSNPLYAEHITKMCEARRDANLAKVKYDSAKMWAELMRTKAATERAANKYAT
jgi:hypothetical protein